MQFMMLIMRLHGSMTPELHRRFKNSLPYEMLQELKSMFEKQSGVERFDLIQTFHACKQEEGKPVSSDFLKMKGYVDQLKRLGYVLPQDLSVGLIINGLTSDFAGFGRLRCKGVTKQIVGVIPKGLALRVVLVDHHSKDESGKGFKLEVN
ncbi:hypothetical protein Tco_0644379 [Tanacetum coccineum]